MGEPIAQVTILYLFFVGIVSIAYRLLRIVLKNKVIKLLYILFLISPFFLYIPVELKTYLYGKEFQNVKIDTGFNRPVIYYKVFSIDDQKATLFYVEGDNGNHDYGTFYHFVKVNGKWEFEEWGRLMWTNLGGSASEFTLPPYF